MEEMEDVGTNMALTPGRQADIVEQAAFGNLNKT